ncbi:MAG: DUF4129 domain-containing protein [Tannerella sp.]|jgi:hypothetical protein|nr:DUF4129 domain-containing protein [Tannerella sp.]
MELPKDTVIYDVGKIADYQANRAYAYEEQLKMPEYNLFEMLARWFNDLLRSIFGGSIGREVTTPIMIIFFAAIVVSVLYFLYKKRPELFMRTKKSASLPYEVEEETIHGIDFEREIATALKHGDYRLAIRYIYLQTLRFLSDNSMIDWQIHKTPTEYLYDMKVISLKPAFRQLTNRFLQVRYGNYPATAELTGIMRDLQTDMINTWKGLSV